METIDRELAGLRKMVDREHEKKRRAAQFRAGLSDGEDYEEEKRGD